jgi:hypothetical protein
MEFLRAKPQPQPQRATPMVKDIGRRCKHLIKRDERGRVKSEEFIGCSRDEIKMIKDGYNDYGEDY